LVEAIEGVMLGFRGTAAFVDSDVEVDELGETKPDSRTVRPLLLLYILMVAFGGGAQY
jgi:hypothetical protein